MEGYRAIGRHMRRKAGRGSDREVSRAMGKARDQWGGLQGDGQVTRALGRVIGRGAGRGSDGVVYGARGRARERQGGI